MAKPWEETWRQSTSYAGDVVGECDESDGIYLFDGETPESPESHARAKLAAAAPEMARLLLELEWAGGEYQYDHIDAACPSCGETELDAKHKADCKLVAVLVKAGVRAP